MQAQQFPFGVQHQAYRPGTLIPTNHTQSQLNQHVADYYDVWKGRWLGVDSGGNGWRVKSDSSGRTVSEGQGYGMVIVAAMAGHDPQAKAIFDGLWQFRLAHPSEIDNRLMDWEVPNPSGNDSAFDGDADIAYGLLMAHAQWGSVGAVDYLSAAKNVIAGIRASTIGPQSRLPMLGDWVSPNGSTYSQWTNVITDIQSNESANTGLLPDFIKLVGASRDPQPAPNLLEGANDGNYWYNAGRDPWRLGVDAILNDDPVTLAQVQKLSDWARISSNGNPNNIRGGYKLDGTALNSWQDIFFIAPLAVAAMTGEGAVDQQWLNSLYSRVYQSHNTGDYYGDAVTLQSLLAVTGNFWDPMAVLQSPQVPGDFDEDGDVDADDLSRWRSSFGANNHSDGKDFLLWQRSFQPASAASAVPEPAFATLLTGGLAAIAASFACRRTGGSSV